VNKDVVKETHSESEMKIYMLLAAWIRSTASPKTVSVSNIHQCPAQFMSHQLNLQFSIKPCNHIISH